MNFIVKIHSNNDACETVPEVVDLVRRAATQLEQNQRRLPQMDRGPIHDVKKDGQIIGTYRLIPIDITWACYAFLGASVFDAAERVAVKGGMTEAEELALAREVCRAVHEAHWKG